MACAQLLSTRPFAAALCVNNSCRCPACAHQWRSACLSPYVRGVWSNFACMGASMCVLQGLCNAAANGRCCSLVGGRGHNAVALLTRLRATGLHIPAGNHTAASCQGCTQLILTGAWSSTAPGVLPAVLQVPAASQAGTCCARSASRAMLRGFPNTNKIADRHLLLATVPAKTPEVFFLLVCAPLSSLYHPTRSERCLLTSQQPLAPSLLRSGRVCPLRSKLHTTGPAGICDRVR